MTEKTPSEKIRDYLTKFKGKKAHLLPTMRKIATATKLEPTIVKRALGTMTRGEIVKKVGNSVPHRYKLGRPLKKVFKCKTEAERIALAKQSRQKRRKKLVRYNRNWRQMQRKEIQRAEARAATKAAPKKAPLSEAARAARYAVRPDKPKVEEVVDAPRKTSFDYEAAGGKIERLPLGYISPRNQLKYKYPAHRKCVGGDD